MPRPVILIPPYFTDDDGMTWCSPDCKNYNDGLGCVQGWEKDELKPDPAKCPGPGEWELVNKEYLMDMETMHPRVVWKGEIMPGIHFEILADGCTIQCEAHLMTHLADESDGSCLRGHVYESVPYVTRRFKTRRSMKEFLRERRKRYDNRLDVIFNESGDAYIFE